jgi:Kdo2-lipid IVA lauroyltransferase/acyltransferase
MLKLLAKSLAQLSLPTIHFLGAGLGWLIHFFTPAESKVQRANLTQAGFAQDNLEKIIQQNIAESGKGLLETLAIWQKTEVELLAMVKNIHGWHIVENALKAGKGIIFLTPHLGCFEITSIYYGSKNPITVLFRPPKLKMLQALMDGGRSRNGVSLAEANAGGVRKLMQALKRGEAIGILPDQIPKAGEGEWADFFGKPAYTMTLACKLAEKTGATVIMAVGERLANGAGYDIYLTHIESIATADLLNKAIEAQVAKIPSQYLWRYDRYKQRRYALAKLPKTEETNN